MEKECIVTTRPIEYNKQANITQSHGAVRWAQSELFFRLLLKNTVRSPQIAAYANFYRVVSEDAPINSYSKLAAANLGFLLWESWLQGRSV